MGFKANSNLHGSPATEMRLWLLLVAAAVLLNGCALTRFGSTELPVRLRIVQREAKVIPGIEWPIAVHIGYINIARGRVPLTLIGSDGNILFDSLSVAKGEVVSFSINGREYLVKVLNLRNAFVGEPYAELEVSNRTPD